MTTPELIGYIRSELDKGRTREEVSTELKKDGGWNEMDLSEAFRIVIPMQPYVLPIPIIPISVPEPEPVSVSVPDPIPDPIISPPTPEPVPAPEPIPTPTPVSTPNPTPVSILASDHIISEPIPVPELTPAPISIQNSITSVPNPTPAPIPTPTPVPDFIPSPTISVPDINIPDIVVLENTPKNKDIPAPEHVEDIKKKKIPTKKILENLVFIVIAIACVSSWYFYRPQIISFWNSGIKNSQELSSNSWNWLVNGLKKISIPSFSFNKIMSTPIENKVQNNPVVVTPQNNLPNNNTVVENTNIVKDCGTYTASDLNNPLSYKNYSVLACLGDNAVRCSNARASLKSPLFPTLFQIIKNGDTCDFKLSYGEDSALVDIAGKKLAGQYISCPLKIVKAVDESKKPTSFNPPDTNNLSKYASQIYLYGTLGIFAENNVSKNKILGLGCSGPYIDSVIESYSKMRGNW